MPRAQGRDGISKGSDRPFARRAGLPGMADPGVSSEAGQRSDETARVAALKSRRRRLALPMTILGEIGLADVRETLQRQQRQPLPGDREGYNDRAVAVLAPTDETLFEFLRELEKTADRFPPDPRHRDGGQVAYFEGAGTGGVPLAGDAWIISARHVLVDAVCDLPPGLLLSVILD